MWKRNLLFIGLCVVGLGVFQASVFPPEFSRKRSLVEINRPSIDPTVAKLDAVFEKQWSNHNLTAAPPADDLAIARRLSLGLMGVVPSLAELREFEAQPADRRLDWWLASILADPRCDDYVAERLARSYVGVEDGPFLLFRRRRFVSWLADELGKNTPYDQIVRTLIAEQGVWTTKPAVNFITVAIKPDSEEEPNPSKLAVRVSRAFLGTRLDCAECHDHPFADWKQHHFQSLAAYFGQTKRGLKGITDGDGEYQVENIKTLKLETITPAVPYQPELLAVVGTRRERLAAWVTHRDNKAFARTAANRAWAILFGRPLIEPVDSIPQTDVPETLSILADDFVAHNFDLRRLFLTIAETKAFRRDSKVRSSAQELTEAHTEHWAAFPITRLRPEQVAGGMLQAASLETIDREANILQRAAKFFGEREFIERYGDAGADEFEGRGGTIPQRLLMMNGNLVADRFKENAFPHSSMRIAELAPSDEKAVEIAMLCVLSRRPTIEETAAFAKHLAGSKGTVRQHRCEDLYWTLLNSTEFAWNH